MCYLRSYLFGALVQRQQFLVVLVTVKLEDLFQQVRLHGDPQRGEVAVPASPGPASRNANEALKGTGTGLETKLLIPYFFPLEVRASG